MSSPAAQPDSTQPYSSLPQNPMPADVERGTDSYHATYAAPVPVSAPAVAMSHSSLHNPLGTSGQESGRLSEKNRLLPNKFEASALVAQARRDDGARDTGPSAPATPPGGDHAADQGPSSSAQEHAGPGPSSAGSDVRSGGHRRSNSQTLNERRRETHRRTTSGALQDTKPGHRRNTSKASARSVRGSSAGSAAEVAAFPLNSTGKPMVPQDEDDDFCPTCLELYTEENPKMCAECGHHFHLPCVLEWMERKDTCPICEAKMSFPGLL